MTTKKQPLTYQENNWKRRCSGIADVHGIDVSFFTHGFGKPVQDDGNLHVCFGKVRACFHIGQDHPDERYNEITRKIMGSLNRPVTDAVLQSNDDPVETCPHCGEPI